MSITEAEQHAKKLYFKADKKKQKKNIGATQLNNHQAPHTIKDKKIHFLQQPG